MLFVEKDDIKIVVWLQEPVDDGPAEVYQATYMRWPLPGTDCNDNGVFDAVDIASSTSEDCDTNTIPDECESDFDNDGMIDACDIYIDGDNVLNDSDVCDFTPPGAPINEDGQSRGDINDDCVLNLEDYGALAMCLSISGPGDPPILAECLDVFDVSYDTYVDLADVASFQRFFGR